MIDGFPLSFFLPLVVHALAVLTTGVTGVITFSKPKRGGHHPKWGGRYLWAYTVVFLTAIILSVQHWPTDAYLVVLATCRLWLRTRRLWSMTLSPGTLAVARAEQTVDQRSYRGDDGCVANKKLICYS